VTVASPRLSAAVNAAHLTAIMLLPFDAPGGLEQVLQDRRRNAVLIGPGCSVDGDTRTMVGIALRSGAAVVLDADALTSFARPSATPGDAAPAPAPGFGFLPRSAPEIVPGPDALFAMTRAAARVVLTPHAGEFARLFGAGEPGASKIDRTRAAAAASGAVVVFKGADTVIAAPDGRAAVNINAPPWLATAGSGDVLAGFVTGLLAQGMSAFEAACAAVWMHGACADRVGPGLIAEDIPEAVPGVFRAMLGA
jgi:NAD(P)H-hydrate epimerase